MITDAAFKDLDALDKKLRNMVIRRAQRAGAKVLAAEIRARAPVETGRARRSVKVRAGRRRKDRISTNVEVTGGHDEGFIGFVEFGTKDHAANPFIRSSVIARRADVVDAIAADVEGAL